MTTTTTKNAKPKRPRWSSGRAREVRRSFVRFHFCLLFVLRFVCLFSQTFPGRHQTQASQGCKPKGGGHTKGQPMGATNKCERVARPLSICASRFRLAGLGLPSLLVRTKTVPERTLRVAYTSGARCPGSVACRAQARSHERAAVHGKQWVEK